MRSCATVWFLGAVWLATSGVAQAQEGEPAVPAAPPAAPEWHWVQVLASPRIIDDLTAVAVSRDATDVYVGSASGIMLRSQDGGTLWTELEPEASETSARDLGGLAPRGGCVGDRDGCVEELAFFVIPPFRAPTFVRPMGSPSMISETEFPVGVRVAGVRPGGERQRIVPRILGQASEQPDTEPVRRITLCPESHYPLVAATSQEVLGSEDEGYTWVRLLRFPGRVITPQVVCDPNRVDHLVIATEVGMWESFDGGITLNPDLAGWPRRAVHAVEFGPGGRLYMSSAEELFVRDAPEESPERIYPRFRLSRTIPWEPINWITPQGDDVWLATQDGVRRSRGGRDGGFINVAPNLLSRQRAFQIVIGESERGTPRVAVIVADCRAGRAGETAGRCRTSHVLASDDQGETWHPFFSGITRRTIQQMAYAGGRWWVLTGGELWVTAVATPGSISTETMEWARERLASTPPMAAVVDAVLDRTDLDRASINQLMDRGRGANWLPLRVSMNFEIDTHQYQVDETAWRPDTSVLQTRDEQRIDSVWAVYLYAMWALEDTPGYEPASLASARRRLYSLRRSLSFVVEDAWHERRMHLRRLARGFADALQAETLRERIIGLEAVLEIWLDGPLDALAGRG